MRGHAKGNRSGSLLVVTLWMVTILSVLAVAIGRYLSTEVRLTKYRLARAQARMLARSGVWLAMQQLGQDAQQDAQSPPGQGYDWLGDEWALPVTHDVPQGRVDVHIYDEEHKLSVKADAAKPVVAQAVKNLLGDTVAQAIHNHQDAATTIDSSVNPPYVPKGVAIERMEELWDLPAISALDDVERREVKQLLQAHATTYTDGSVNINTADQAVLTALLPTLAQSVLDFRWDPGDSSDVEDGNRIVELTTGVKGAPHDVPDPPMKSDLTQQLLGSLGTILTVRSNRFAIVAEGMTAKLAVKYRVTAIVERRTTAQPLIELGGEKFRVLAWREG